MFFKFTQCVFLDIYIKVDIYQELNMLRRKILRRKLFCIKNFVMGFGILAAAGCTTLPVAGPYPDDLRREPTYRLSKLDEAPRNKKFFGGQAPQTNDKRRISTYRAQELSESASTNTDDNQSSKGQELNNEYALIEVDDAVLNKMVINDAILDQDSDKINWPIDNKNKSHKVRINVGDTISLTIYESQSGGVFIPIEAGIRPGNFINLPPQVIDDTGKITVPYAGEIDVIGKTPVEVSTIITNRLQKVAIEPQVIVSFTDRAGSEVSVLGTVNQSTRYSLNFNGERVLDAISRAQGPSTRIFETIVTLIRDQQRYSLRLTELLDDVKYNVHLKPNDTLFLEFEPEVFMLLGSSNFQGRYNFNQRNIFVSDAIGRAGGLNDNRADPADVYLYRRQKTDFVRSLGVDIPQDVSQEKMSVLYKFNLRDPYGMFLTQRFPIENGDVVYIGNAEFTELTKLLSVVNTSSVTTVNTRAAQN